MDVNGLYHGLTFKDLVDYLEPMEIVKTIDIAILALLILEYIATIPLEIKFLWPTRFTLIKFLYFVNRHVIFIAVIFPHLVRSDRCLLIYMWSNVTRIVAVVASEALLFVRVWALSGNNRVFGVFICIFLVATGSAAMILTVMFTTSAEFILSPWSSTTQCINTASNTKISAAGFALLLIEQFTVAGVSLYITLKNRGIRTGHIANVLYRDGAIYIFVLTFIAIINILIQLLVKSFLKYGLNSFHFAMHSILCTRMVLHLRKEARMQMGFSATAAPPREVQLRIQTETSVFVAEDRESDGMSMHTLKHPDASFKR